MPQHLLQDLNESAPSPRVKHSPSSSENVPHSARSRVIWGFMLENTYFTEFDMHNHRIIEDAYHLRKMRPTSHYIAIRDSHLPAPARVYFGVAQVHLRMPGTRYYVKRRVVYARSAATAPTVAPTHQLALRAPPSSTLASGIFPSLSRHASDYVHSPHHYSRPHRIPAKKPMRSISSTGFPSTNYSQMFVSDTSTVQFPICSSVASQNILQYQPASNYYQSPISPPLSYPPFLLSSMESPSLPTDWVPSMTTSTMSSSSSSTTSSSSGNSSSIDSSIRTSIKNSLDSASPALPVWPVAMDNPAYNMPFHSDVPSTTCSSSTTGITDLAVADASLSVSHFPEWYTSTFFVQHPEGITSANHSMLMPDPLPDSSLQSILSATLPQGADLHYA